ncbi:MAG: class I SAM-dependent methyltransferase [Candidatus Zixiibacteriota bacterium]|nr:MAG: class I SAM-dependent methyltransferase [candidate division Zixibacteria bacterium]
MKRIYDKTIEKPCGFMFARWSAGAKAFELSLPPDRRVITDKFAPYYAGRVGMQMVQAMNALNPSIRKGIVLRAKYMDEYAVQCIKGGAEQVVILGAGYDSRYLRLEEFRRAKIYELDLHSTQVIKKALTRRLLGRLPANVTYVPIDFSKDSIDRNLIQAGFQRHRKSLFIWEGVTLFLNQSIIAETLGRLAELGEDNMIVFDFIPPELIDDETDYKGNRALLDMCASIKEPLTFGSRPAQMEQVLKGSGFDKVRIISLPEAHRMYGGTGNIENCYYFATAEVKSAGDGASA